MLRICAYASVLLVSLSACAPQAGDPSPGAKGMPGAMGTFEFKPTDWVSGETTYWIDTDGIAPGIAGCHLGSDATGKPNGRMFGEACLPDGRLVETNPGKNKLHGHRDDTGSPDTFDCNAWCVGQGGAGGKCVVAPAPPCEQSAKCLCN